MEIENQLVWNFLFYVAKMHAAVAAVMMKMIKLWLSWYVDVTILFDF